MKINLTQEEKMRLVSLALAGALTTGIPTMASAETIVKSPLVGEVQTEVDYTEYVIQEGDTLGGVAERLFGNAGYWEQIADFNKSTLKDPNKLSVGDVIRIPNTLNPINCNAIVTQNEEQVIYVEPTTYEEDGTYIVQQDECLTDIINKFYKRIDLETANKLATYNDLDDPNMIYADQILLIPCIEKLDKVVSNDYSEKYAELQWRLEHPECYRERNECQQFIIYWDNYIPTSPCHTPEEMPEHHCHHRRVLKP